MPEIFEVKITKVKPLQATVFPEGSKILNTVAAFSFQYLRAEESEE